MFGSTILDTAIGLAFVFLLLSLIATAFREALEVWLKLRAVHLERGIKELLHDSEGTGLAKAFYDHPLVRSLYRASLPGDRPSYVPARNFALTLLDLVVRGSAVDDPAAASGVTAPITLDSVRLAVGKIQNPPVQRAILAAVDTAAGSLAQLQKNLEDWYDSAMDRVSGGYKRQTQGILLAFGLALAAGTNVDAIAVARHLYRDTPVRTAVAGQAERFVRAAEAPPRSATELQATLDSLGLPIGYPRSTPVGWEWVTMILGWIITALAVSLGAPFWFDVLNKFMVIRSTVKPKEKSPEEGSEDRRPAAPAARGDSKSAEQPAGAPAAVGVSASAGLGPGSDTLRHEWANDTDPDRGEL